MQHSITAAGAGALAAAALLAGSAAAQTPVPSGPPPSWQSLIPCAQKSDPVEGFKCYQAAMKAAGFSPNPQIAAAEKRRTFGLQIPGLHGRKHEPTALAEAAKPAPASKAREAAPATAPEPEPSDQVTVTLDEVAVTPPLNRLLMVTTEGAVWVQTDSETVAPLPRAGQTMTIVKGSIDGFFCKFDKRTKVRCVRRH